MLRAVLFDLDNTLHDKKATLRRMPADQFAAFGLTQLGVDAADWTTRYGQLNQQRISKTRVFEALSLHFQLPIALAAALLRDFDARLGSLAVPVDGAQALLRDCRARGLKLAVVSNVRDAFQRSKWAGLGWTDLVDLVVTSGELGIKKPDLRLFRHALAALDVAPEQAVMVGDDLEADIQPALALGMRAIWRAVPVAGTPTPDGLLLVSPDLCEVRACLMGEADRTS
jgi:HAD superfamily hydrolase (TIGR01509 family)